MDSIDNSDNREPAAPETTASPRISWVWLVPLVVVLIAGWTIYQTYIERGVTVEIAFSQGKGIEAGKTEIRYKDVVIGRVESLRLTEDFEGVVATALLDREVEPYLGPETDFWVVSAEISGTSFRGLTTLLSGAYIEVDWPGTASNAQREFAGQLHAPLTPPSVAGQHFRLKAASAGSLSVGSQVSYRGIPVGQVERSNLSEDYQEVEYEVFINAPFDALISNATRFFDVSGVNVSLNSDGLAMHIESLRTLAAGGLSFYTPRTQQMPAPVKQGRVFTLFESQSAAEESFFETDDAQHFYFTAVFEDGIEGLEPGAAVMWQGVRLGTVRDIRLDLKLDDGPGQLGVVLDLQPARIGFAEQDIEETTRELADWVEAGMRVEIANSNLLTGSKRLNLVLMPEAEEAELAINAQPFPRIPTVRSSLGEVPENISNITSALAGVPFEELAASATSLLTNASALLASSEAQALPASLQQSLSSIGELAEQLGGVATRGEDALAGIAPESPLYTEMAQTIRELRNASRAVSALATLLEENPNALLTGRE